MSFATPLIVVRVYTLGNWHWVLRLLLIAPTCEYLSLKFDPLYDRPHIVGPHEVELAVVDLIAGREGIEPQQRKKWAKILDAFSALAFAFAPLSTFIGQTNGVSCHPTFLLTLHCTLSRSAVKGTLQVPHNLLLLRLGMAETTLYFSHSKSASTPRTLGPHWEVAWMYTEIKSVNPVDTCFSCDGTPRAAYHECKNVRFIIVPCLCLCQLEICVGLLQ